MKRKRKVSEAHISRAVRIREQRDEFATWTPDLKKLHDDQRDRKVLRRGQPRLRGK